MSVYHVVETGVVATVVAMSALSMMGRYAPVMRARAMRAWRAGATAPHGRVGCAPSASAC